MKKTECFTLESARDGLPLSLMLLEPEGEVRALVQLSHGMVEHKERYLPFMRYLAERGCACVINDHRGHGASVRSADDLGYFYQDGDGALVDDLHQIIYNLTENAIKYNRPGGFVRVTLGGTEDECVLRVEDNGIGIPEEDMPRVFDRFYRVDKMRSRAAGGTGLGLSIVADTVRRRGGSIAVSARAGGGTCFTVRLPAVRREGET